MLSEEIDGLAFMLLSYPVVKSQWSLQIATAVRLCRHVESVRAAHLKQFGAKAMEKVQQYNNSSNGSNNKNNNDGGKANGVNGHMEALPVNGAVED